MTSLSPVPTRQDASWIWHHPDTPDEVLAADLRRQSARRRYREIEAGSEEALLRRLMAVVGLGVTQMLLADLDRIKQRLVEVRREAEEYGR